MTTGPDRRRLGRPRQCPHCAYVAYGPLQERAHMEAAHPQVVADRLAKAGEIFEPSKPSLRIEVLRPAYEKRHDDPTRNYGIGCALLRITLPGPYLALSLAVFTGWYLPVTRERLRKETQHRPSYDGRWSLHCALEGQAGALTFHYAEPNDRTREEGGDCDLMPAGRCYSDVGYSIGEPLFDLLVTGGEPALLARMIELRDETLRGDDG